MMFTIIAKSWLANLSKSRFLFSLFHPIPAGVLENQETRGGGDFTPLKSHDVQI